MRQAGALTKADNPPIEIEITPDMIEAALLGSLRESDPSAFIQEMETGIFLIDGNFNVSKIARRLCKMLPMRRS